jgi:hypothetical protein
METGTTRIDINGTILSTVQASQLYFRNRRSRILAEMNLDTETARPLLTGGLPGFSLLKRWKRIFCLLFYGKYKWVSLAALFVFWSSAAQAQIAPGPLSNPHEHLAGIFGCTACHNLLHSNLKCISCHTEIRRRVEAGTGFHARAYKRSVNGRDCSRCHMEHRGADASLIPLDRKQFDHSAQTGFTLEGKHRELACGRCHNATKISAAGRAEIKVKDLNRSFLGLRRECAFCHREPHQGQLGKNCSRCHSMEAWKPASKFDHSRTAFPLTGMHQKVACERCHARQSAGSTEKKLLFKGLGFTECNGCHADQHKGAFLKTESRGKCQFCHDTNGFTSGRAAKTFNHDLTGFSLVGKHGDLPCSKCHEEGNFSRPIAHKRCAACHEAPHKGQFEFATGSPDCSSCHDVTGFKSLLFNRANHASGRFPLVGKHADMPCEKCHQPEGTKAVSVAGKHQCAECHADPHGGEFAGEPYNNKCDLCHSETGFAVTTFSVDRHARTRFPLTGRHAEVQCLKCHRGLPVDSKAILESAVVASPNLRSAVSETGEASNRRLQFHFASQECSRCHRDPHNIDPGLNISCETCHTPQEWRTLLPFDHSQASIRLEGAHKDVAGGAPCKTCHGSMAQGVPVFSGVSFQCSGCHTAEEPHGGQFSTPGDGQRDCSSCHSQQSWAAVTFNHNHTPFALSGAHRGIDCVKCHKTQTETNGKSVRSYRGTPTDCLGCH